MSTDKQQEEWEKQHAFVITGQDDRTAVPVDCRSEVGIAVGLIDTILTAANVLRGMDLSHVEVVEALKDLRSSPELRKLLFVAVGFDYGKIKSQYESHALESAMLPHPQNLAPVK